MNENKFVDYEGLRVIAQNVNARLKTVTELPEATSAGKTVLYVGESGAGHINGHIYQSKAEGEGFAWSDLTASSATGVIAKGTRAFSELPSLDEVEVGWMYNISDDFTTNENFVNAEIEEKLGSNVYCIEVEEGEGDDKKTVKKWDVFTAYITDQSYDAKSTNAQSGKAVAEAVAEAGAGKLDKVEEMPEAYEGGLVAYAGETDSQYANGHIYQADAKIIYGNKWSDMSWPGNEKIIGYYIWTDGENTYYSTDDGTQYSFDRKNKTWVNKKWGGLTKFSGQGVWTDGDAIYYSGATAHYVLNKEESIWTEHPWNISTFSGNNVWSDGDSIYLSDGYSHYILNKNKEWVRLDWKKPGSNDGLYLEGSRVWIHDGSIYANANVGNTAYYYVFDKAEKVWKSKYWSIGPDRGNIWSDGENTYCYYYRSGSQDRYYVLKKGADAWTTTTWINAPDTMSNIWTDGKDIYSSESSGTKVLSRSASYSWVDTTASAIPTTEIEGMFD